MSDSTGKPCTLYVAPLTEALERSSGFLLLVDAKTKQPVGKLTRDMSKEDIRKEINKALKS